MINILLVDDEPIVRMGFKTVVDWHCLGFDIAGEAGNGREALSIFGETNIDIIVTDIKMPIMDGIELISAVKNANPGVTVIVLSSYDDYSFVQKAFKLGTYDYILKSDINEKNIKKLFSEIKECFKTSEKNDAMQAGVKKAEDERQLRLTKLFRETAIENRHISLETASEEFKKLGCDIIDKYTATAIFSLYKYSEVKSKYGGQNTSGLNIYIENIIEGASAKFGRFFKMLVKENEVVLLFICAKSESMEKMRERISDTCSHIVLHSKRFMNINTTFGVSNIYSDRYVDIKKMYDSAKAAQKYCFVEGACKIIWYYQIEKKELNEDEQDINDYIATFKKILSRDFMEEHDRMVKSVIVPKPNLYGLRIDSVKKIYGLYSMLLFEHIELSSASEELKAAANKYIHLVRCEASLGELNAALEAIMLNFRTFDVLDKNPVVEKIKRYASKNYNMPITSRDAAQNFDITQEHLCRVFSNETGISFTKYITELRIDKAKELLAQGNIKIKQVGSLVGYTNNYYFCKVFKRVTGFTPTEYAKKHMNIVC